MPQDLVEQVRGRVQLLALFLIIGIAIDPLFYFVGWIISALSGRPSPEIHQRFGFQMVNLGMVAVSLAMRWAARSPRVSINRLIWLGLAWEIVICFLCALTTYWEEFVLTGALPSLTWVAAIVILFPMILPAPPRRMLAASIVAAAMSPLSLLLLDQFGMVQAAPNNYVQAAVSPAIAVVFAYLGARNVHGMGRALVAARELGSYRLEEKLGEGGMGEVWRARHRMLARPAAIKLIRSPVNGAVRAGVSEEMIRRFEREAQTTASLRSPHTVNVFDFGVSQDGSFYYVMELLDGLDANTLIRRFGPVPAERAVFLLLQMCHSLSEAESVGLVHRDIKPANIFVCRYGEDLDFVKVLDFGLVKALSMKTNGQAGLTRQDMVQGTPAFIAPEQILGKADIDGRADIYGTGCVAYWLLTGQLVFDAPSPTALLVDHVHTPPAPPSSRTDLPIPEALDRIVLECLEKDPARRPQSARELSRRLAEAVAPEAWTEVRAKSWWSTHELA
jgi:serine/threonine-protein kinase